jgi:dihydrodipicolinate synthase/N-acetylneuraminate lyase
MKTAPITIKDLESSVIAVPPLCRDERLRVDASENARLIRHIEGGGVSTLLYGGNANFYNIALSEYDEVLGLLAQTAAGGTHVIPSVGPFYGTAMDQAEMIARHRYPTAMLLPTVAVSSPKGVEQAVLRIAEKAGVPLVLYVKDPGYVTAQEVKNLVNAGVISWIKYAVVRTDPAQDDLLQAIVDSVDRSLVVGGIGEQPAIAHWHHFGLRTFTSGCVCVAPRRSQELLHALHAGDFARAEEIRVRFQSLEDLRNDHGPIPVLHTAVAEAEIARTGPMLPLLTDLPDDLKKKIRQAAQETLAWNA